MVLEKTPLSFADIEAQTALELPDRETPAVAVVTCLAICIGNVTLVLRNIDVTVLQNVCAELNAITVDIGGVTTQAFNCTVHP